MPDIIANCGSDTAQLVLDSVHNVLGVVKPVTLEAKILLKWPESCSTLENLNTSTTVYQVCDHI